MGNLKNEEDVSVEYTLVQEWEQLIELFCFCTLCIWCLFANLGRVPSTRRKQLNKFNFKISHSLTISAIKNGVTCRKHLTNVTWKGGYCWSVFEDAFAYIYFKTSYMLFHTYLQGSANPQTPGLLNFVTAVAYHFCLNLPRAFSQPGARGLADPCKTVMESQS